MRFTRDFPYRGREGHRYLVDPDLLAAANAALELEAPLLLTGEPGCGKTQFAWAAASALAAERRQPPPDGDDAADGPLASYVRSDTTARDLLYHYDAIRRFGDAQHGGEAGRRASGDARHYIELRPLGRALMSADQRVVLIDEIDKAPRDLPNDLLRELDEGQFEIPEIPERPGLGEVTSHGIPLQRHMKGPGRRPFVVITSNVERELPDAFLRRCIFYHIPFPDDEERLARILAYQLDEPSDSDLFRDVLKVFLEVRRREPRKKPATAEATQYARILRHPDWKDAREVVRRIASQLRDGRDEEVAWHELPAIGCLLKTRQDIAKVTGRP
jgi:MoxR-like ATPase